MSRSSAQIEFEKLYQKAGFKNDVEAANALHLSAPSVSKIRNGKQDPRPVTLELARRVAEERTATPEPRAGTSSKTRGTHYSDSSASLPEPHEIIQLKESFAALVKTDPDKALSLTEVISYLRSGKKKPGKRKSD